MDNRRLILKNACVIDGLGNPPTKRSVCVENGKISGFTDDTAEREGWESIDLDGKYLMPGLIEMHGHFYANRIGYCDDVLDAYTRLYLAGGVTTVRSCGEMHADRVFEFRDAIERGERTGPRIVTAGWYLNRQIEGRGVGWMPAKASLEEVLALYESQKERMDQVKVYNCMPADWIRKVCEVAHSDGFRVYGHLTECTARDAVLAGLDGEEHGSFYMSEFYNSDRSSMFSRLRDFDPDGAEAGELIALLADKGTAVTPTNVIIATLGENLTRKIEENRIFRFFGGEELRRQKKRRVHGDADAAGIAEQEEYMRRSDRFLNRLYRAGGRIFCGTDPVYAMLIPGYSLVWEAEYLHERCGIPNDYLIRALTSEAAKELGIFDRTGSLEEGKLAELIVLSGNPLENIANLAGVERVFRGGKEYDSEEIRKDLEGWFDRPFREGE